MVQKESFHSHFSYRGVLLNYIGENLQKKYVLLSFFASFFKNHPQSRKGFSDLRQVGFCAFGLKTTSLNSTLRHKNQLVFSLKSPFYFSEMAFEKVCA